MKLETELGMPIIYQEKKIIWLLIVLIIGIPNFFVAYDNTGLQVSNDFDVNKILRIGLFTFVGFLLFLVILRKRIIELFYFKNLKIPILFYSTYLVLIAFGEQVNVIESVYRIVEWFVFFFVIYFWQIRNRVFFNFSCLGYLLEKFIYCILSIVILTLVFKPEFIVLKSVTTGFFRLGGYAISPNSLGLVFGISFSYFFFLEVNKFKRRVFTLLSLSIIFLTISRGAIVGLLISISPLFFMKSKYSLLIISFSTIFAVVFFFWTDELLNYILRGHSLEYLFTLSDRLYVFQTAIELGKRNFFLGAGFVNGTDLLPEIFRTLFETEHWSPRQSHNDFIQAFATGGIVMLIFTIGIFSKIFRSIYTFNGMSNEKFFILSVCIQLLICSFGTNTINWYLTIQGGLIWLFFVALQSNTINYRLNKHRFLYTELTS